MNYIVIHWTFGPIDIWGPYSLSEAQRIVKSGRATPGVGSIRMHTVSPGPAEEVGP